MIRAALLVLALALSTSARADVWKDAIAHGAPDPNRDTYDKAIREGDSDAVQTMARGTSRQNLKALIDRAVASYREAAAAEPNEAEPYFKIAKLVYSHYFDCGREVMEAHLESPLCDPYPYRTNRAKAEQVISSWNAAELRAPLDPRFSEPAGILFEKAILETKLASKEMLVAAARDYEKLLARIDSETRVSTLLGQETLNNLAETYMMLDRLDDAIETYQEVVAIASSADMGYGLAVALDRNGQTAEAIDTILKQGTDSYEKFRLNVRLGDTFFVPAGEQYYYLALSDEAYGRIQSAVTEWQEYIQSGAHPEFQPRAKQHLEALQKIPIQYPHWGDDPFPRMAP